jgi:hypothetical protein
VAQPASGDAAQRETRTPHLMGSFVAFVVFVPLSDPKGTFDGARDHCLLIMGRIAALNPKTLRGSATIAEFEPVHW